MVLQRWYPFGELRQAQDRINRIVQASGGRRYGDSAGASWAVPLDVVEDDDNVVVRASLPGAQPDEIEVTVEDGILAIKAHSEGETETKEGSYLVRERRTGSFHRSLRLPDTVDAEKAESTYENGVLSVSIPKQEAKKARRLEVKVAA